MNKKKIKLITGGAGFLGINLAKELAKRGYKVRIFDVREPRDNLNKQIEFFKGDIIDYNSVYSACDDVDVIFNLASLLPCSRAGNMFIKVNVGGTKNVLDAALNRGIKKIVHLSSSIVYGIPAEVPCTENCALRPVGDYGRSKVRGERICQEYRKKGINISIIRTRMIIGAGRLGLLTILFDWIRRGKNIYLIGNGRNRFQMVDVYDLINACILAMGKGDNEVFNIGAGNTPQLYDLIEDVINHAKTKSKIVPINAALARNTLMFLDFLKLTPLNVEHYLVADKDYVVDTAKARKILGWKPKKSMPDSMNDSYDYYIKNYKNFPKESSSDFPEQRFLKILRFFS